jgi:uncharacterized protein (TIGR03435 family)
MRERSVLVQLSHWVMSIVAIGVVLGTGPLHGQVQSSAGATPAQNGILQRAPAALDRSYDIVTIKLDKSGKASWRNSADGFSANGALAASLIQNAYGLLMPNQIVGLPGWAKNEPLEVQAKMDADTVAALDKLPPVEQWHQRQRMLQALLAERFALKVHHATKQLPIYVLTVASGGSRLKKSATDTGGSGMYSNGKIVARATSIENLAMNLSSTVGRIIVDKTGLASTYDFTLEWAPAGADADDPRPSIFTALEEQMGLKLTPAQGPVDTIVVDSIQRPSEN